MSSQYKLMVYFAHSTMCMYSKDVLYTDGMTVNDFATANPELIKRVCEEAINIMEYELSHEQVMKACHVFLITKLYPKSVHETVAYVPKLNS